MKFDYCIGNPPYQESKNGNNKQLWPDFLFESFAIADKQCIIHPGRWVVPTANMIKTRDRFVDNHLSSFLLFNDSNEVFPGTTIAAGITITFFDNNKKPNSPITYRVSNHLDKVRVYDATTKIFLTDGEEECYRKLFDTIKPSKTMQDYVAKEDIGYNKFEHNQYLSDDPTKLMNPVKIWAAFGIKGATRYRWTYIDKNRLNADVDILLSKKKVGIGVFGRGVHANSASEICGTPCIIDKDALMTGMFIFMPLHDTPRELQLIRSLFMTRTARYLMTITQKSIHVAGFENIPDYIELAKLLPEDQLFSDEWFYRTFDFSQGLINEIETRVSPKVDKEA